MPEVVLLAALQVRHKIMNVHVVGLERSSRAQMEVADAVEVGGELFSGARWTGQSSATHTLLTLTLPAMLQPSVDWALIFSVQPSLTHWKRATRATTKGIQPMEARQRGPDRRPCLPDRWRQG